MISIIGEVLRSVLDWSSVRRGPVVFDGASLVVDGPRDHVSVCHGAAETDREPGIVRYGGSKNKFISLFIKTSVELKSIPLV